MALLPDPPFPKARGDSIRSKDWNDTVVEVQRLDTAKVNRAGDTIGGPLTVTGNLGVGGAPADAEGLDRVLDLQAPTSAKLTVRTAVIDTRVLAHQGGFWGAPAGMVIGTRTAHPLSLGTNAAGRLTIDSAGLVGIGTQPQARLHVAGGQGDPSATGGDLKVGDANFRLKTGVAPSEDGRASGRGRV